MSCERPGALRGQRGRERAAQPDKLVAMRIWITAFALLVACSGDAPDVARDCNGTLYDACLDEHDCEASGGDCRNFMADGFQACSKACTPGDDSTCPATESGGKATCNNMGVCKPPAANRCML